MEQKTNPEGNKKKKKEPSFVLTGLHFKALRNICRMGQFQSYGNVNSDSRSCYRGGPDRWHSLIDGTWSTSTLSGWAKHTLYVLQETNNPGIVGWGSQFAIFSVQSTMVSFGARRSLEHIFFLLWFQSLLWCMLKVALWTIISHLGYGAMLLLCLSSTWNCWVLFVPLEYEDVPQFYCHLLSNTKKVLSILEH